MGSVVHVDFKRNDKEIEAATANLARALGRVVEAKVGSDASFAAKENAALEASNDASRQYFEETLQELADSYEEEVLIDGVVHKRSHDRATCQYHSLCGPLCVERATYRKVGERNGPTVIPLELEAGLAERATPALCYSVGQDYGKGTSREYVESMEAAHRKVPSRSTVERIGKALGTKANRAMPTILRYLRRGEKVPEEAVAISLGLDRTSVPYEEKREQGAPPATRRKHRKKPYVRRQPDPVDVNYRMEYVGTFSLVNIYGETLVTRKYAATQQEGPEGIVKQMMADLRSAMSQYPLLKVGVVQDGAPELWKLLEDALEAENTVFEYFEAIDRYHLSERWAGVLNVVEPDAKRRQQQLVEWEQQLDDDDDAIVDIYTFIAERELLYRGKNRKTLASTLTFIENNHQRMQYATLLAFGLPVGSGVTEGACKSLVGTRVKRSGQRWHPPGVSAVLTLRSILHSERFPRFWGHLHRRYTARVEPVEKTDKAAA
jgi:hypothetical protein